MERFETMKKLEYSDDGKCVYGGRAVKGRIDFPEGVTEIASCAFMDREKLRSVTLPNSLVEIGRQAFWNCQSLTLDALPQNLRSLGIGAFAFTGVHGSLTIPSGVTRIESQAFKGCNIWSVSFSPKLTEIGSCAFRLNNLLHEVELPKGLKKIDFGAFELCDELDEISFPDGLISIGKDAFANCPLKSVFIPASVVEIGGGAFVGMRKIDVAPENPNFITRDGVLFTRDMTTLVSCPQGLELSEYRVPDGVTTIAARAFDGCKTIEKIVLPNSVRTIGDDAFRHCDSLKAADLPDGTDFNRFARLLSMFAGAGTRRPRFG